MTPAGRRSATVTVVVDALAVLTGVVVYFGVRGSTVGDPSTALLNARAVLRLERRLGLDVEQRVQSALGGLERLTTAANWIYVWGHWPVIAGTLLWLALRRRQVFRRMRDAMLVSGAMGLCVYTTYPVAPPRLSGLGMIDTVAEQSRSYRVLQPAAFVNQYAAMPSLHVGWDLVVGLSLIAASSAWSVRLLGALLPLAMALATIVTANHYVLDVLFGAAFGLVGWGAGTLLERRRAAAARDPVDEPTPRPASPAARRRPCAP